MNKNIKFGITIGYITIFTSVIMSLMYTPYLVKSLGESQLAMYNLAVAITGYFAVLNAGLGSSYIRFFSKYRFDSNEKAIYELNGLFFKIFGIMSLIVLISSTFFILNIDDIFKQFTSQEVDTLMITLVIMILNLAITLPASIFEYNIIVNEKFIFNKTMALIKIIIQPILIVTFLFLGYKTITIAKVQLATSLIFIIFNIIFCFKYLNFKVIFSSKDKKLFKEIFIFSSFVFLIIIVEQINWAVDKIILGANSTILQINIYTIGAMFNYYFILISHSMAGIFTPMINQIVFNSNKINEDLSVLFARVGRLQFMILFMVFSSFIFFGQDFLQLYLGSDFKKSYYVTVILMLGIFIPLSQSIGQEIVRSKNLHRYTSIVFIIIALINVSISIPLASSYGAIGPALATAGCVVLGEVFFMNVFYHKKVGLDIKYFWSEIIKIFPALIIPVISGIIIYVYTDTTNILNFLFFALIYVFIYLLSLYSLSFNFEEKSIVNDVLKKVKNIIRI